MPWGASCNSKETHYLPLTNRMPCGCDCTNNLLIDINSIKKKKKKKVETPVEEAVKFADYKEPEDDKDPQQDTRTPAEIAYEKAQQKRVSAQPLNTLSLALTLRHPFI
jgi:hypothetical protein